MVSTWKTHVASSLACCAWERALVRWRSESSVERNLFSADFCFQLRKVRKKAAARRRTRERSICSKPAPNWVSQGLNRRLKAIIETRMEIRAGPGPLSAPNAGDDGETQGERDTVKRRGLKGDPRGDDGENNGAAIPDDVAWAESGAGTNWTCQQGVLPAG